jgi:hypothetical protein
LYSAGVRNIELKPTSVHIAAETRTAVRLSSYCLDEGKDMEQQGICGGSRDCFRLDLRSGNAQKCTLPHKPSTNERYG